MAWKVVFVSCCEVFASLIIGTFLIDGACCSVWKSKYSIEYGLWCAETLSRFASLFDSKIRKSSIDVVSSKSRYILFEVGVPLICENPNNSMSRRNLISHGDKADSSVHIRFPVRSRSCTHLTHIKIPHNYEMPWTILSEKML